MSNLKHTPGPWKVNINKKFDLNLYEGGIVNKDGEVPYSSSFKEDSFSNGDETEESMANDRLIAAAPEMFETLIYALKNKCKLCFFADINECMNRQNCKFFIKLSKIIEKASNLEIEEVLELCQ